jgi:hypothetical protein
VQVHFSETLFPRENWKGVLLMAETIQRMVVDPPIAVGRLGGSTTPQNAYKWVESANLRSDAENI